MFYLLDVLITYQKKNVRHQLKTLQYKSLIVRVSYQH